MHHDHQVALPCVEVPRDGTADFRLDLLSEG